MSNLLKDRLKLGITALIGIFLIFLIRNQLSNIKAEILYPILIIFSLTTILIILIAFLFLNTYLKLEEKSSKLADRLMMLHSVIKESYRQRNILVSNEMLKEIEQEANLIRIISPDLYDDEKLFYDTILQNIKKEKRYEYIFPKTHQLERKMTKLIKHLMKDANIKNGEAPIRYRTIDDSTFPIVTAYGIYRNNHDIELTGVVEVKIGPNDNDVSHLYLSSEEVHRLDSLFENLFKDDKVQ